MEIKSNIVPFIDSLDAFKSAIAALREFTAWPDDAVLEDIPATAVLDDPYTPSGAGETQYATRHLRFGIATVVGDEFVVTLTPTIDILNANPGLNHSVLGLSEALVDASASVLNVLRIVAKSASSLLLSPDQARVMTEPTPDDSQWYVCGDSVLPCRAVICVTTESVDNALRVVNLGNRSNLHVVTAVVRSAENEQSAVHTSYKVLLYGFVKDKIGLDQLISQLENKE